MKRKLLVCCALLAAVVAGARTLSPEEALSAALNSANGPKLAPAATQFALARTVNDGVGAPAVYVFTNTDKGFLVTPADDCAGEAVLGYGDVMGEALPPNMQAWLDEYARQIEWLRDNPEAVQTPAPHRSVPYRKPIAPLCKSLWGQAEPYNGQCPEVGGQRSVTGCLATAMAQIMYQHAWPAKGTGSVTYNWKVGGTTYTDSFDFENTGFDWYNMQDDYSGSYTENQAKAVATLMHACGVASYMQYSPSSSGSSEYYGAQGLIDNLNYNKALAVYKRNWFDNSTWEDMIYTELEEHRPVLYCGVTSRDEGHAFVCDGYSSNGFYHINWGWTGLADGYYVLSMLNPTVQGTGGAVSGMPYNYKQSAVIGIRPYVFNSELTPMMYHEGLVPDKWSYSASEDINFENAFYSFGLGTIVYDLALACKKSDGSVNYETIATDLDIDLLCGFASLSLPASLFPDGEYDCYFAFRRSGTSDWQPFYCDLSNRSTIHLVKDSSTVTLSEALYTDDEAVNYSVYILEVTPQTSSDGSKYYPGHTYDIFALIMATSDAEVYVAPVLCRQNGNDNELLHMGDAVKCILSTNREQDLTPSLTIPAEVAEGEAFLGVAEIEESTGKIVNLLTTKLITVEEESALPSNIVDVTPAEYFTLQGVKVATPVPGGLYLRRQGEKVEKVLAK